MNGRITGTFRPVESSRKNALKHVCGQADHRNSGTRNQSLKEPTGEGFLGRAKSLPPCGFELTGLTDRTAQGVPPYRGSKPSHSLRAFGDTPFDCHHGMEHIETSKYISGGGSLRKCLIRVSGCLFKKLPKAACLPVSSLMHHCHRASRKRSAPPFRQSTKRKLQQYKVGKNYKSMVSTSFQRSAML